MQIREFLGYDTAGLTNSKSARLTKSKLNPTEVARKLSKHLADVTVTSTPLPLATRSPLFPAI